jgi:hypothetical protein
MSTDKGDILDLPYAIDFDGVIAESIWPDRGIGEPMWDNIQKLLDVYHSGHEIIIHTARPWSDKGQLEAWLDKHDIPYDGIICGKLLAIKYIDDRAINSSEGTWL